ncbi:MAG: hypothetical protein LBJ93_01225 [Clostridiales bacterium]|jgi:hypothetical protein|nr:hypothetical protein [Clostridiales bacterium]
MGEEYLAVLKLLEQGKITVDDAERLFDCIKNENNKKNDIDINQKLKKFATSVENLGKTVAGFTRDTFENAKPKLKKVTKISIEKTSEAMHILANKLEGMSENFCEKSDICNDSANNTEKNAKDDLKNNEEQSIQKNNSIKK